MCIFSGTSHTRSFISTLFASNGHGLCSHTLGFAFLSHKPSCASGVDPALLCSGCHGACQGSQTICLENVIRDGCWDRALWYHGVTINLLVAASPLQMSLMQNSQDHQDREYVYKSWVTYSHRLCVEAMLWPRFGFMFCSLYGGGF